MNDVAKARLLELIKSRALTRREVTLASGQGSNFYVDGKMVLFHGESATLLGDALREVTVDLQLDALGGPDVGALPMATAAVMAYHRHGGKTVEGFFVRKEAKQHGLQKRIEGSLRPGWRVAVVEDVMTTGSSALGAVKAVQEAGATVAVVICM